MENQRERLALEKQRVDNETKLVDSHGKVVNIVSRQQGTIDKQADMLGHYVEMEKARHDKAKSESIDDVYPVARACNGAREDTRNDDVFP